MSGGHFNYKQDIIKECAEDLFSLIREQKMPYQDEKDIYSKEILKEFEKGLEYLEKAYIYLQAIDWLVCGDTGEESFLEEIESKLKKLKDLD